MQTKPVAHISRMVWVQGFLLGSLTFALAFVMRMLEWPAWQNIEFRLGSEWLLATHDAYHWLAGAEGFGLGQGHPMAQMLKGLAVLFDVRPAAVAFWFPAVLASLLALLVFVWVWALGSMAMGLAAGVLTSLAPGFLARTLLGYYDTDLVTLFFPLIMTLAPACWAMRYLLLPQMIVKELAVRHGIVRADASPLPIVPLGNPLSMPWLVLLGVSGVLSWWTQEWHSVFPYLIRYNVALLFGMTLLLAPAGQRGVLLLGSAAYALPTLCGLPGLLLLPVLGAATRLPALDALLRRPAVLMGLWGLIACFAVSGDIAERFSMQLTAYLKQAGDAKTSGGSVLVYPAVSQSIIEVQDLDLDELLHYFHPWIFAAAMGFLGFVWVCIRRQGALFLLPLAVLALLSMKLGGRMVMFGAPIVAIGLSLPLWWILRRLLRPDLRGFWSGIVLASTLLAVLATPFVDIIPAMSQGPVLDRRHAEALTRARSITPEDAILWTWWDWGYAAQYFAQRKTIADGAVHSGPSLYIPAAVFSADSARFARQLIKYTALYENEAGQVFQDMDNSAAAALMSRLRSPDTPLIQAPRKQYVVVSFEMLRLGFWITTYGNWSFEKKSGTGYALSIVPQQLSYRLDSGQVRMEDGTDVLPSSITVFEDRGMTHRDYIQEWFDKNPHAPEKSLREFLSTRRNVHFLFNRVTNEKLIMDEALYSSLMVQLLIGSPSDSRFAKYFKLVYSNGFVRIYEVV